MRLFKKPLPQVLKDEVMDPIGASDTWRYHGYRNSYVTIDGKKMQSVTGGTRWGAGIWINSFDHARFGYLFLRKGQWGDKRIISEKWIDVATTRGDADVSPDLLMGKLGQVHRKRASQLAGLVQILSGSTLSTIS